MAFDDIPEDREQTYMCGCRGEISQDEEGIWKCDKCGKPYGTDKRKEAKEI